MYTITIVTPTGEIKGGHIEDELMEDNLPLELGDAVKRIALKQDNQLDMDRVDHDYQISANK